MNQILFVDQRCVLDAMSDKIEKGARTVPCELEQVMFEEAQELIRGHYENFHGL